MNKLTKTLALGILMFSTLFAISNTSPAKEKTGSDSASEKTIRDYFKFPQVLIPHNNGIARNEIKSSSQKVEVLFTTDKTGSVNFVLVKTNNPDLKNEVEKQFRTIRFNKLKSDVVHSVTLSFKTL